jgi:hypothetical protein
MCLIRSLLMKPLLHLLRVPLVVQRQQPTQHPAPRLLADRVGCALLCPALSASRSTG